MKNKITSLILCISMLIVTPTFGAELALNVDEVDNSDVNSVVSGELFEILNQQIIKGSSNKIPVSIEYNDNYDAGKIETMAYQLANVDKAELQELQVEIDVMQNELMVANLSISEMEKTTQQYQRELLEKYDKVANERTNLNALHIKNALQEFVEETGIEISDIESACRLIPLISLAWLTPEQILELAENPLVTHIEYVDVNAKLEEYSTSGGTIIGGDVAINNGYKGANIKVGVVDVYHPMIETMGTMGSNVILTNEGGEGMHSTRVCTIIKRMAPSVTIYSRAVTDVSALIEEVEVLIDSYDVHVVNMSCGVHTTTATGYNNYSRGIDQLIYREKRAICIAAGNPIPEYQQTIYNTYINLFGLSPNAITVGAVTRTGTNPAASGAYQAADYSIYREKAGLVNKPDICAPGNVSLYGENRQGTSYATPFVTGIIAQMLSVKSGLTSYPELLKAILLASATYNGGTSMGHVENSIGSNREGAGVVDAKFCYYAVSGAKYAVRDIETTGYYSTDAWCSYTDRPFRIAATWDANSPDGENVTRIMDLDMSVYKNGVLIASSAAYVDSEEYGNANYEIISIPPSILQQYGAGYYQIKIGTSSSTFQGPNPNRVAVAWEQIR